MRMPRRSLHPALLILGALLCAPTLAYGADDPKLADLLAAGGDALLTEADDRHNPWTDQKLEVRMTLEGGGDAGKSLQFTTITKGENRRAIRFEAPKDMKGMGVVIKGSDEIYVRLPDNPRVRRVASHARRQSFQGTDWSFDDMALIRFAKDFTATITDKDVDGRVVLALAKKADSTAAYEKLVVHISRDLLLIDIIEYYGDGGKKLKVQSRSNPKKMAKGHMLHHKVVMEDLQRKHRTITDVLSEEIDSGVKDRTFSRRWLVRGI